MLSKKLALVTKVVATAESTSKGGDDEVKTRKGVVPRTRIRRTMGTARRTWRTRKRAKRRSPVKLRIGAAREMAFLSRIRRTFHEGFATSVSIEVQYPPQEDLRSGGTPEQLPQVTPLWSFLPAAFVLFMLCKVHVF